MILVTGAAGYIGSHILVELLQSGHKVIAVDNLSTGSRQAIHSAESLAGRACCFFEGDIRDREFLNQIFNRYPVQAVIHLAGLKVIEESIHNPLDYYDNNVTGSQQLLIAMEQASIHQLIFSSSAAVYGEPATPPIDETCTTTMPTNPYGRSKLIVEEMLTDLIRAPDAWRIGVLRYFNPAGAHKSGLLGEYSGPHPSNLVPHICQVAQGYLPELTIFGNDYPTPDGTGIRDYLHVVDLARGHLAALDFLQQHTGRYIWNLGTGRGYSVLEMVRTFEKVTGCKLPYRFDKRRTGDVAACWTNPAKAWEQLGWRAEYDLEQMLADVWQWQQMLSQQQEIQPPPTVEPTPLRLKRGVA